MTSVRTVILGGGMSGLSCAYHLREDDHVLLERSDEPGGLSRSIKKDGFVYDHTGHLLHLRNPYTLKWIPELLGDNLGQHRRRAWIYSHGVYTPYPYQANLNGLPARVVRECVQGLVNARLQTPAVSGSPESLQSWVLRTFGAGFAKHFFFPYNEKLWCVPPDVLTAEWVAPFVPQPSIQEVIEGAVAPLAKDFGYNATFYYPKEGGIQSLAFAVAKSLRHLRLRQEVTKIDLARKEVETREGETFRYQFLVNSLPLVRFLGMAQGLPPEVQQDIPKLRWSSVYNINLGIDREQISDKHWIYFPEKRYAFYRVGFPMNFAPSMTPPGYSSMYVEIGHGPDRIPDERDAMKRALRGLTDVGLLKRGDRIVSTCVLKIPIAYVTYDAQRTATAERLLGYLQSRDVHSIGRFGRWKYSYMEEAILEGKAAAETILSV